MLRLDAFAPSHRHGSLPGFVTLAAVGLDLVVIGLGYVGLPLAREAARSGLLVAGLDLSAERVAALNTGRSHVDDVGDDDVAAMLAAGFVATTDPVVLARAEVAVICVPTPLRTAGQPDLSAVEGAARWVRDHLHPGMLVVLESTTYPGTTDEVVRPILEESGLVAGTGFHLAFSPERIDPGNPTWGLRNTPKIVGGHTPECTEAAAAFYGKVVDTVVRTKGTREAEMAKLLENTYRHVNIALVNEMAIFSHEMGIDFWDVIEAARTKPFGFQAFTPGAGVGGHCIPIDPNYLSYRVRMLGYQFRFVELAQEINARMPSYVATRAAAILNERGKAVKGSRVLLLGVTFKPDVSDERQAPAQAVGRRLHDMGAEISYADPYVPVWRVNGSTFSAVADLGAALADADLVIMIQPHAAFDLEEIQRRARVVLDTSGRLVGPNVERL
jgi:UDP-N-acetyl-D-glucosamine dehydrogenase